MLQSEIIKNIQEYKKEKDVIILAHYYQPLEIQDMADFVGDSFDLSVKARDAKESTIVFCGVKFMAETAKILSPTKTVLFPNPQAICPMAQMISPEEIIRMKQVYPDAEVVCYVNTTAEVKAVSDVCVTSSSAVNIVNKLSAQKIIFVPDKNLAHFVHRFTDKKIIIGEGYRYVHNKFQEITILKSKEKYPNAKVLVHPECPPEVIDLADEALSTSGMINYIEKSDHDLFIIGTENGLIEYLQRAYPEKTFFSAGQPSFCINMKKIRLGDLHQALYKKRYEIFLSEDIIEKASKSLQRMIELNS
ncbi:MAG: quinolinate synthase NadA [Bacteroidota bacterium]